MTSLFTRDTNSSRKLKAAVFEDEEIFAELMRPVAAGARARGVADAFEMMGMAAVLIDAVGRVLHAAPRVTALLGSSIRLVEGHLLGVDAEANRVLQRLVASAIRTDARDSGDETISIRSEKGRLMSIRALRFPQADEGDAQLLRAILVVEPVEG